VKSKRGDLVYLEWLDAMGHEPGWKKIEDIQKDDKPALCHSVGWIIKDTEKYLTIIGDWNDSEDGDREQVILKQNITKRTKLRIGK